MSADAFLSKPRPAMDPGSPRGVSPEQRNWRGAGLSLALRLYLLLAAICLPAFLIFYAYMMQGIKALSDRQVNESIAICQFRLEDWINGLERHALGEAREREELGREIARIVAEPNGVDSISVFQASATSELTLLASHGPFSRDVPSPEDLRAYLDGSQLTRSLTRAGEEYRSVSVPIGSGARLRGVFHIEVAPDKVAPTVPALRRSTIIGAVQLLLALGVGVVGFFQFAVGKPIHRLMAAMRRATQGDLTEIVPVTGGEFGRLAHSYNHMMLQLRASSDENRRLIEQVQRFNEDLQVKIREATGELQAKHLQLQVANDRLFSLQRQLTRLEKLASLGQVSTILAHELGTPLNAISGHLQLLAEELASDPGQLSRLAIVQDQVDRLTRIVREVLETMRMPPPGRARVDLPAVLRGVIGLVGPLAERQGILLEAEVASNLPHVLGDSGQLEQLLMNLLTNAMDAMPQGGKIRLAATSVEAGVAPGEVLPAADSSHEPPWVAIEVRDSGQGIAREHLEHIFDPFFTTKRRSPDGGERVGAGLGLGLSICDQIAKNHGGRIQVESREGEGSSFRVLLPGCSHRVSSE